METWSSTLRLSPTGFGRGCQCAKGTQDTESSISHDTLKPDGVLIIIANKETKRKLHTIRFLHMSSWWMTFLRLLHRHVFLMNDLAKLHVVCFSNDFPRQAWLIQTAKSLTWTFMWNTLWVFPWRLKSRGDYWHIRYYCFPNCFQEVLQREKNVMFSDPGIIHLTSEGYFDA